MNKKLQDVLSGMISACFIRKKVGSYIMDTGIAFQPKNDGLFGQIIVAPCIDLRIHSISTVSVHVINQDYEITEDIQNIPLEFQPTCVQDTVVLKCGKLPNPELSYIRQTRYGTIEKILENDRVLVRFTSTVKNDASLVIVPVEKKHLIRIPARHVHVIKEHFTGKKCATSSLSTDSGADSATGSVINHTPLYNHTTYRPKQKYKEEQVVVINGPNSSEYLGLVGTVFAATYNKDKHDWFYEIDVNNAINRTFALTGLLSEGALDKKVEVREFDLSSFQRNYTDKQMISHGGGRKDNAVIKVWDKDRKTRLFVYSSYSEASSVQTAQCYELPEGKSQESIAYNDCNKYKITELDWFYDKEKLLAAVKKAFFRFLAIENEVNVYLYLTDENYSVQHRIFLGEIKKSHKFEKSYDKKKLKHPWDVYRYLDKKNLGHFYSLFTADEYTKVGHVFDDMEDYT